MRPGRDDYALLILLGLVWGFSFLLVKLAVGSLPPITVAAGRIVIGALALALFLQFRGGRWPSDRRDWAKLVVMGFIGNVLPFSLISWGQMHIDSGLSAILMAAIPLSTILIAHVFAPDEPLSTGKLVGVVLGIAVIVALVGPTALEGFGTAVAAEFAVVAATVCYAVNAVIARHLSRVSVEAIGAGCLIPAAAMIVPFAAVWERPWQWQPTTLSVLAVIALGLISTAGGYLLLFRLIGRAGAGFASLNNFLVPLFGVLWGMLFLGERPGAHAFLALCLVLAGLAAPRLLPARLTTRPPRQSERPSTSAIE
jgi:drug/metabolite transporter (DMT)-like permease